MSAAEDCMETVQGMCRQQFNSEQCGHLTEKLKVVGSSRAFVMLYTDDLCLSVDIAVWAEIFKYLLALSFVQKAVAKMRGSKLR